MLRLFQECVDCLTVILLLEPKSMSEVLEEYLQIRLNTLGNVLRSDDNPTVKEKLSAALLLLQHTLLIVATCFIGKSFPYILLSR